MLNVIPKINGPVRTREGGLVFPGTLVADLSDFAPYCLTAFSERTGLAVVAPEEGKDPWVFLNRISTEKAEEYHLTVGEEGVTVEAATEEGVIAALTTLYQLSDYNEADCTSMTDEPRWERRGLQLDCARNFVPVEELKKILEQMSLVKLNVFQWKLSDDQAWRLEVVRAPKLTERSSGGAFYTRDDVKEVVAFAKSRGIEVVPEIHLPGHVTALLHAYPQYSCYNDKVELATVGGLYAPILCAGFEGTYDFLDRLFEEITTLFPSEHFHIGGGVALKDDWATCPVCRTKLEKEGLKDTEELFGFFLTRVSELLEHYGKKAVFYNDALETGNAPVNGTVQYWNVNFADATLDYADEGHAYVYSDFFELALDYPHSLVPLQKVYAVAPHIGRFVAEDDPNLKGLVATVSTEHLKDLGALEQHLFPRIFALAEAAWAGPGKDYEEFLTRLRPLMYNVRKSGVQTTPERWWDPTGNRRREDALSYYQSLNDGIPEDVQERTRKAYHYGLEYRTNLYRNFFKPSDAPLALAGFLQGLRK